MNPLLFNPFFVGLIVSHCYLCVMKVVKLLEEKYFRDGESVNAIDSSAF